MNREQMTLLDEKIVEIGVGESKGFDQINDDISMSFTNQEELDTFITAITTAYKDGKIDIEEPMYNLFINYDDSEGNLPTHLIHLWLGEKGERSKLIFIDDDEMYVTSEKMTEKLRNLILGE